MLGFLGRLLLQTNVPVSTFLTSPFALCLRNCDLALPTHWGGSPEQVPGSPKEGHNHTTFSVPDFQITNLSLWKWVCHHNHWCVKETENGHVPVWSRVPGSRCKCICMCAGAPECVGAFVCRGQHSTTGTVPQEPSALTLEMGVFSLGLNSRLD